MDVGTIQQKLAQRVYTDPSEIAADIAQVWTNCKKFNEPDAEIVEDAIECENAFIQFWIDEGVYQSGSVRPSVASTGGGGSGSGRAVAPARGNYSAPVSVGGGSAFRPIAPAAPPQLQQNAPVGSGSSAFARPPPPSAPSAPSASQAVAAAAAPDWQDAARKVLYRMINFMSCATWFITPVSAADVPDYHQIIKKPMDLSTVLEKVKADEYETPDEVAADVELIWNNAIVYNGLEHPVAKAAIKSKEAFEKLWTTAGLDPRSQHQRQQQLQQRQQQQQQLVRQKSAAAAASAGIHDAQNDWVSVVRRVLGGIMNLPACVPFNGPISDAQHPGYSQIVESHMDFGQILRNLGRGRYQNSSQVMLDIRLLFSNWRKYGAESGGRDQTYQTAGLEVANQLLAAWQRERLPVNQ
jgi:hypothetical protein